MIPVPVAVSPLTGMVDRLLASEQGLSEAPSSFLGLLPHATSRLEAQAILLRPPVRSAASGKAGLDVYPIDAGELNLYFWSGVLVVVELDLGKTKEPAQAWARWGDGEGQAQSNELLARRWSPGGRVMELSRDGQLRLRSTHPHRLPRHDHFSAYGIAAEALRSEAMPAADRRASFYGLVPGVTRRDVVDGALGEGKPAKLALAWAPRKLVRRVSTQVAYKLPGGEVVASFDGNLLLCLSLGDREDAAGRKPDDLASFLPPAAGRPGVHVATNGVVWVEGPGRPRLHLADAAALRSSGALYRIDAGRIFLLVVVGLILLAVVGAIQTSAARKRQETEAAEAKVALESEALRSAALPGRCGAGDATACLEIIDLDKDTAKLAEARFALCRLERFDHCEGAAAALAADKTEAGAQRRVALRERGCAGGAQGACTGLASELMGPGAPKLLLDRARGLLTTACEAREGTACVALAKGHLAGRWGNPRAGEIRRLLSSGCDLGSGHGCHLLVANFMGGAPSTATLTGKAAAALDRACALAEPRGCGELGIRLLYGTGLPADQGRAEQVLQQACELGNAPSCVEGGLQQRNRLQEPYGAPLFRQGCQLSSRRSCTELEVLRYEGHGGEARDRDAAMQKLLEYCKLGEPYACFYLATVLKVRGEFRYSDRSLAWLNRRACELGVKQACG